MGVSEKISKGSDCGIFLAKLSQSRRSVPDNVEIAGALVISQKTVRNHVSNIFNKLQVADRAQTIIRARDARLG
ncbi:MAG: LuxR C-terminal-related transcriptional regulator [Anaerolineales bacterium]|nr:MAG: LuxR C-terminal-related transcriptional regulator [Anaerolineales bacterium]